ncbi:hypothetical protein IIA15_01080 [candidate division TA06 bacterium]|nr:hypothetical protein [candidate division TA06 bacterium]
MATIQEIKDAIKANPNHLALFENVRRLSSTIAIITLEYWNSVGNDKAVGYVKKYIVTGYATESENCYEGRIEPV